MGDRSFPDTPWQSRVQDADVDRPHCAHCGDIVGVYEPARLLLADGTHRHGSRLTLGDELDAPGATVVQERCYEAFEQCREKDHGG